MSINQIINNLTEELRNNSTATIMFHQSIGTKLGLNPTDHKCLDVILKNQPITAGRLSELTGLTTGAITGVLDRLEKVGYIIRVKDPQDKRRVIIHLNQEKAEKDILPLFQTFGKELNQLLSSYDEKELQTILNFIKQSNCLLKDFTDKNA
ncbi:MarR family winged helix-turn-helix transcriptional regulator [Lederbergia wuyishanensis]|uniref:DNA-binding MarR family transcriptional regulator n=1 Tax=Lederbergia wuyishanensis TaxID=1347903 RepID=A0ABU0D2F8_9BACI|nr:MarR family transcriptional regulator [Lederbergia wuyishanensis]MCJ8007254.1 MarR family transcriptional regulator [Lederbergia wuyishanensis]MDQ0342593.1 DNA-binding MarR family transcriptional regulator [Lederbergia wuyishanensis]